MKGNHSILERSNSDTIYLQKSHTTIKITMLPEVLYPFLNHWCLERAIHCAINLDETIIKDSQLNKYEIVKTDNASIVTISKENNEIIFTKYVLISYKSQKYYMISITQAGKRKCIRDMDIEDQVKEIIESFKIL